MAPRRMFRASVGADACLKGKGSAHVYTGWTDLGQPATENGLPAGRRLERQERRVIATCRGRIFDANACARHKCYHASRGFAFIRRTRVSGRDRTLFVDRTATRRLQGTAAGVRRVALLPAAGRATPIHHAPARGRPASAASRPHTGLHHGRGHQAADRPTDSWSKHPRTCGATRHGRTLPVLQNYLTQSSSGQVACRARPPQKRRRSVLRRTKWVNPILWLGAGWPVDD